MNSGRIAALTSVALILVSPASARDRALRAEMVLPAPAADIWAA